MKKKRSFDPVYILLPLVMLCMLQGIASIRVFALDSGQARWPDAPGTVIQEDGKLALDISNLQEGYFMACVPSGSPHRLKLRVEKDGQTLTYDLNGDGLYEVFPLQLGSGIYSVTLYENVGGKKYAQQGGIWLDAVLFREDAAFLYPNQYIDYSALSPLVEKAGELCNGLDEKDTYKTICEFMQTEFVYDFVRAITVTAGELPDPDGSFEKRMGICQDLSAVTAAMLRTMGIPGRLIIGYAAMQSKEVKELMPALRSNWLGFHVSTAIISYGAFGVSFVLGIIFLLRDRMKEDSFWGQHTPAKEKLDIISYRAVALGLLFLTFTIITGAIWAERAWGSYWSWDPKETWSLVTWIIYAIYLHLRIRRGWEGKAAATFAVVGFICVIFTYIGVNTFLPGLHSYK